MITQEDYEQAIREAVTETIAELGMEAVYALSWFPSNQEQQP